MKLLKHWNIIEQLVRERADHSKIAEQIGFVRDQVAAAETAEARHRKELSRLEKSHAQESAERDKKIAKLETENKRLAGKLRDSEKNIENYRQRNKQARGW